MSPAWSHRNLERIPTLLTPSGICTPCSAELCSAFPELCENKRSLLLSPRKCLWGLHFPVGDLENKVSAVWHDLSCLEPGTPRLCLIPVGAVPFGDSVILVGPFTSGHFVILWSWRNSTPSLTRAPFGLLHWDISGIYFKAMWEACIFERHLIFKISILGGPESSRDRLITSS